VSRKRTKKSRKRNVRTPWRRIHRRMSEVVLAAYVDPRNVSRECPRCGFVVETREGQVFEYTRCDLKMGRQRCHRETLEEDI
jgi:putative transposase